MTERAYTATELNAILAEFEKRCGQKAQANFGCAPHYYGREKACVTVSPRPYPAPSYHFWGETLEEAIAKADAGIDNILKPDDAYAILGIERAA